MTSLSSSTTYPPSILAYPHLKQLLDSFVSAPYSSASCTFTLFSSTVMSTTSDLQIQSPLHHCRPYLPCCPVPPSVPHSLHLRLFHFCPKSTSAVRQLTRDSQQQQKPRHRKQPQLQPGEAGIPTKRILYNTHTQLSLWRN